MEKSEELRRFEEDMAEYDYLRTTFDAAIECIVGAESDYEAIVIAAGELGYELSLDELERLYAESQEPFDEELDEA